MMPIQENPVFQNGIASPEVFDGWVHNLSPFLLQISGNVGIRWYGLAYLTGFICGYFIMVWMYRRCKDTLPEEHVGDLILAIVLGTMLGGRVGYAIFYGPELLSDFSTSFPFWGVLRVWTGGMASHGGILGIILATVYFAKTRKQNWLHLGDLATMGGSIGIFCGRIANFINGELYGRPISAPLAWAVKFPSEAYLWLKSDIDKPLTENSPDLLPRLQNAAEAVGIRAADWLNWCGQIRTQFSARAQVQMGIERIISATELHDSKVIEALRPVLTARHPSQLYEGLLEGALLFLIAFMFWRKPRRPGLTGGVWLISYAIVRIVGEQFRMPDAHIGFQLFGLTRGQWLSIAMLVGSFVVLAIALRAKSTPLGGWQAKEPV